LLILLTNDDGIFAPGLVALRSQLERLGEVCVVAPSTEKSGVSHSITYLTPLMAKEVTRGERPWGWAVDGNPADCAKIGITKFCPRRPDLVVSGMNNGLNAGINVLYSGTVAAAVEASFFNIDSIAVSLEFDNYPEYDRAAKLAVGVIEQLLEQPHGPHRLMNINIPTAALSGEPRIVTAAMDTSCCFVDDYEVRHDPWGRRYYWIIGKPRDLRHQPPDTDLAALDQGMVTITPLHCDLTNRSLLGQLQGHEFRPIDLGDDSQRSSDTAPGEFPSGGVRYDSKDGS